MTWNYVFEKKITDEEFAEIKAKRREWEEQFELLCKQLSEELKNERNTE